MSGQFSVTHWDECVDCGKDMEASPCNTCGEVSVCRDCSAKHDSSEGPLCSFCFERGQVCVACSELGES